MVNDKISDVLIRIKNAGRVGKKSIVVPHSKMVLSIAEALLKSGFVSSVTKKGKKIKKTIEIELVYEKGKPKVTYTQRLSKLSQRVYFGYRDIKPVRNGYGLLVLSTPKGIMSGSEARKENVGGEVLFKIW